MPKLESLDYLRSSFYLRDDRYSMNDMRVKSDFHLQHPAELTDDVMLACYADEDERRKDEKTKQP